jgi:gamma-glutamyltranspeptidase
MDEDVKTAIDTRRPHHQLYPEYLELENNFPERVEEFLKLVGNRIKCFQFGGSVIQAIQKFPGYLYAYADPRKGAYFLSCFIIYTRV